MKVESKYKNPDRHIEGLKRRLDEEWRLRRVEQRKRGDFLFNYRPSVTYKFTVTDRDFGGCRTQRRLIVEGRICHTEENCESSEVTIDRIVVRLKDETAK